MQISIKGYIASKESELFYDCADRYAYNKSQNKFAISDGVSKSFFPKIWADVLVKKWVDSKEFDEAQFILDCQQDWLNQVTEVVNKPDAKWFTKNAFNRKESGLATFVGLRFFKKKTDWFWKANALGDSFLFFVPNKFKDFSKECIVLSSKQEPIVFDNFPDYLNSLGKNHKGEKQLKENPLITGSFYLMTDALAEWFLNEKEDALNKISLWQNQKDFERFVNEERHNEKLGNDDSAILIISIEEDKKDKLTYVLEDVSDIDALIKIQQKEIEDSEKAKEQKLVVQKENSNSAIETEQLQQVEPEENKLSEELETEIEKPKKGFFKRIFGEEENELSNEKEEIEADEKIKATGVHQEEKKPSTKGEQNNSEIEKSENPEKNESQESEQNSKEEPESSAKTPNKPSQNITDKF
ncbi:hypothetical protein [Meridianimaribacter flavus]|uniref:Protein phosphatase 2C domain-containing protein n=1 Tax=Meridianimaribacter flavus TaxID=571115 RepID=A0ABY2G628_9FLAO|nr:hypothetical protein [Meridianimaribacter flavus]TDY11947.1 hypothetical protein A8975_1789 [Meridianimaribacter flavus]